MGTMETRLIFHKVHNVIKTAQNKRYSDIQNKLDIKNFDFKTIILECELYNWDERTIMDSEFIIFAIPEFDPQGMDVIIYLHEKSSLTNKTQTEEDRLRVFFKIDEDGNSIISVDLSIPEKLFSKIWNRLFKYIESIRVNVAFTGLDPIDYDLPTNDPDQANFNPYSRQARIKNNQNYDITQYEFVFKEPLSKK